jgi:hypothetical protein
MLLEALWSAGHFFLKNVTVRDQRSPSRHHWRWCLFVVADVIVARFPMWRPKSGMAVILVNRLGDAIASHSMIRALHARCREIGEPFLVLGDRSWEVLGDTLYSGIEVKFIDERRFRLRLAYRLRVCVWLRARNVRVAICFMHHRLEMRDDALTFVSGAAEKIVSGLPFLKYRWYPWLFEVYLNRMSRIIPVMLLGEASKDRAEIARDYRRNVPHVFDRLRHFHHALYGQALACSQIDTLPSPDGTARLVVLNPGAQSAERQWPLEEWVWLAWQISTRGYTVCFSGGPAERHLIAPLRALIAARFPRPFPARVKPINLVIDQLPFGQVMHLFKSACCYIGPDTGASHLAYWLGTPTVTILQRDPEMEAFHRLGDFFPYPANVLNTPFRCVWATLDEFHVRNGSTGVRRQVWDAFLELTDRTAPG